MSTDVKTENGKSIVVRELGKTTRMVNRIFRGIFLVIYMFSIVACIYWTMASDRYVSEAVVLVQNTETGGASSPSDLLSMFTGGSGNKTDQMLLIEFLTSIDMLNKLDSELDLRGHYSDTNADIISRMWSKDISTEWFYKYFKNRVTVVYDEYSGVVRISAQAFDPETATKITTLLVQNGEDFMNKLSHKIADEQVLFLSQQVEISKNELLVANEQLLDFQNKRNMVSPTTEVENYQSLIANLEKQKSEILVKIDTLPANLGNNNHIKQSMLTNIKAIEEQISKLREKITNANEKVSALNELADEERLLKMDVEFKKEIYSSTLSGLAKGKLSAARLIKNVGILQSPSKPQYAVKPERLYSIAATIVVMLLVLGILQLLKAVILDHVD